MLRKEKTSVLININDGEYYKTFSKHKENNLETKTNNKNNNNKKVKNYDIQIKKLVKLVKLIKTMKIVFLIIKKIVLLKY